MRARKLRSFDKAGNVLIEKKLIYGMKDIFPRDFIKYLSYSEVQKNSKFVNIWIRSLRVCSKSVTETLYPNNSLVNWCIFRYSLSLCEFQVIRDQLCARGIVRRYPWKIFEQNVSIAYFKSNYRRCSVTKELLKILPISHKSTCVRVSF